MRVLLISEMANPEWVSVPLEGWSHSRAIQRLVDAHIVTHVRNEEAFRRAGATDAEFTCVSNEWIAAPMYRIESLIRRGKGWTTAMAFRSLPYYAFERAVWKRFGRAIRAGEFDIVHRVTPLSPTLPSLIARRCARAGVPFVFGPINGGLPWPAGFDRERRREREWLSYVRDAYKLLPGYRSTRRHASALIIGSRATFEQMDRRYHDRCVYIPENAIDPDRFDETPARPPFGSGGEPMRVAFVGRLVPYKGCDMLLHAAAPLIRDGRVRIDVIGDGPERAPLERLVEQESIGGGVNFLGWVEHTQLQKHLGRAHVFGFPSVREFGGAVVLEAMALGVVPIVLDYGGPGELVTPKTGVAIAMGTREEIIGRVREALGALASDPVRVERMSRLGRQRAFGQFTWDAKASMVREVYKWVLGERDKPDFGMPLPDLEQADKHEAMSA